MENRQGRRCRAFALAEIESRNGNLSRGLIYNVSRDGMFIVNGTELDIKRYVDIRVPHIMHNEKPIQISGMIVHRNNVGFGVMYHRIDNTARNLISKLITHRCTI